MIVSRSLVPVFKHGVLQYDEQIDKISLMPMRQQIKSFLELPEVLDYMRKKMHQISNNAGITHFIQGKLWKNIRSQYDKDAIVIPCFLYSDEVEPDNALGANAGNNKITAFFYSFPLLPQYLLSSPKYVFEALIFNSKLKRDNYDECLKSLIAIWSELETTGICLKINDVELRVFIVLTTILGDNLAIHESLGFTKGFNSTYFCRFCTVTREDSKKETVERKRNLRTIPKYQEHLMASTRGIESYGVKLPCQFASLKHFHPITNHAVDLMHDIFEGIAVYDVAKILQKLIDEKLITLDEINRRKQLFNYGFLEIGNIGKEILPRHLKNGIKMSASEMKCFLNFIPMMLGDIIPSSNKYWKVLLKLCDIIDRVLSSTFLEDDLKILMKKITNYLLDVVNILESNLRPKHHILLHYCNTVQEIGPLRNLMCFVYEQKNKEVKQYAKVTNQRINIAKSLTYKSNMRFNKFIDDHKNGLPNRVVYEKKDQIKLASLEQKPYFNIIKNLITEGSKIQIIKKLRRENSLFQKGLFIFMKGDENHQTHAFEIKEMLILNEECFLILRRRLISDFKLQYRCYFLYESLENYEIKLLSEFATVPVNCHELIDGKMCIKPKVL